MLTDSTWPGGGRSWWKERRGGCFGQRNGATCRAERESLGVGWARDGLPFPSEVY